ncbi:hypothetical protein HMI01_23160 [Halolactibacillus miurensis]|uniref:Formylglycine-generating enzyme, required for sulfatase activity, contains SUMF1/FGE domain n=1 Tax=Halolactibacillus miurensis TaxID=306541 RepID=A0A1I6Q1E3_9BACI|nr:formylglycine-generating enzyme family protein [Halolactibacillus miurensis]GEM05328.1 hypothetical protein HMI01_23160 [Halolactibacillus miurensis]SFS46155.1 Formylglycine-generating enzyme, required for sulfatase activity, contains SUMF1/FGE domain [Halolactibacillus miurensis]
MSNCCHPKKQNHRLNNLKSHQSTPLQTKSPKNLDKMIEIKGGEFIMGTDDADGFKEDNEGPKRLVKVESFLIDKTVVTNQDFKEFVDDTGYVTESEQFGWSFVFNQLITKFDSCTMTEVPGLPWWLAVKKATWFQPEGPDSTITNRLDHPVVHVSWNDAVAYAAWAGKRLPTEKEWEYAARGGLEQNKYPWGNELTPNGEHYCNIWQGEFPKKNSLADGYLGTAPAKSFPPNGYGLYNMSGNVWEWCRDRFDALSNKIERGYVTRGGSFLCHHSYCNRYRVAARTANTPDSSASNIGFRCVADLS